MKLKFLVCCFLLAACDAPPETSVKEFRKLEQRAEEIQTGLDRIEWLVQGVETKTCNWLKPNSELQSNL